MLSIDNIINTKNIMRQSMHYATPTDIKRDPKSTFLQIFASLGLLVSGLLVVGVYA
jgi:hypothetical protein